MDGWSLILTRPGPGRAQTGSGNCSFHSIAEPCLRLRLIDGKKYFNGRYHGQARGNELPGGGGGDKALGTLMEKGPQSVCKNSKLPKNQHNASQKGPFLKYRVPLGPSKEMTFLRPGGGGGSTRSQPVSPVLITGTESPWHGECYCSNGFSKWSNLIAKRVNTGSRPTVTFQTSEPGWVSVRNCECDRLPSLLCMTAQGWVRYLSSSQSEELESVNFVDSDSDSGKNNRLRPTQTPTPQLCT